MDYEQLPDGTWKRKPRDDDKPAPIRIWYMRDNHTFLPLPLEVDGAMAMLRNAFSAGGTYGMLCGRPDGVVPPAVHARSAAEWPAFEAEARPWIERAVALSKPPDA